MAIVGGHHWSCVSGDGPFVKNFMACQLSATSNKHLFARQNWLLLQASVLTLAGWVSNNISYKSLHYSNSDLFRYHIHRSCLFFFFPIFEIFGEIFHVIFLTEWLESEIFWRSFGCCKRWASQMTREWNTFKLDQLSVILEVMKSNIKPFEWR